MRFVIVSACLGLFLTAAPARAEFHPDAHRAYESHWRAHPEHPEEVVRLWHTRLFHREIAPPLLARWTEELKRGVECPLALAHVLASPEYYVSIGSTPDGFVRKTFVEIVGRSPTEAEFHFWRDRMYHADRSQVAYELVTRYPPAWAMEVAAPKEVYEYRPPVVHYHR